MITRAVAANLRGEYCKKILLPPWKKSPLNVPGSFPQEIGRQVISQCQTISELILKVLENFFIDTLVNQFPHDYAQLSGVFPSIKLGVSIGEATSYLFTALG